MRTKTILLTAALSAVTVASTMAQVYSINVVGYVTVTAAKTNFVMIANPLDTGNNVLTNILFGVPGASGIQRWNGAGFDSYTFSTLGGGHWKQGAAIVDNINLSPGVGFFFNPSANYTNTFVGSVVALAGGSVINVLTAGFQAVGSQIPFSGNVTNPAAINLKVAGGSGFQQWNVPGQSFVSFTYNGLQQTWKQGTLVTNPVVSVAEGWFINPSSGTNWVQTLPP